MSEGERDVFKVNPMPQVNLRYADVLFVMHDGREIVVTISKAGEYRLMERANSDHATGWEAPVFGSVVK